MKTIETDTFENAIQQINKLRLENKNKWLFAEIFVGYESCVQLKSYNTSIQILRKNGISFPSTFDCSVKDWKANIELALRFVMPIK